MSGAVPASGPGHKPVLLDTVLEQLQPAAGQTVADLTAGRGGHAEAFARAVGAGGTLVLFDRDPQNLAFSTERARAAGVGSVHAVHGSFATAEYALARLGLRADAVLADLGFASNQMDDPGRGFSFQADGPLDMRLDPTQGETGAQLLARMNEREIADAIFELGEDPFSRRIARSIVARRGREGMETTADLVAAVRAAYGTKAHASRMHPATRTFMALRILVNDELGALRGLLDSVARGAGPAPGWLAPGARVGVISFHSLEDRLVKHAFAELEQGGRATRLTRKPVEASEAEVQANPRARSAKFRAIRIGVESSSNR